MTDYPDSRRVTFFELVITSALMAQLGAFALAAPSAQAAEFETGSVDLNNTVDSGGPPGPPGWKTVNLDATFSSAPVIVAGPVTHANDQSLSVRVRNVTATGFEIALTSPCDSTDTDPNAGGLDCPPTNPGGNPKWQQETVRWMAVPEGAWTFPDGTKIEAARENVGAVRSWAGDDDAGDPVSFANSYSSRPVVLHTVNTANDDAWITSSVFGPGNDVASPPDASGFTLALEGAEVTTSHASETIGWVAIEPGSGTNDGNRYHAGVSAGLDTPRHQDGCAVQGAFTGFGGTPDVVASHNTMQGTNGAWLRYCNSEITTSGIEVHVDEDQVNDGERTGLQEATSWFAFDADGIGLLVGPPPPPLVNYRMDEAGWSGADSIMDASGNNRPGTSVGGAAPDDIEPARDASPGTCGYGTFDGTDDGVEDGDAGQYLNGLSEVTVSAWVYNAASLSDNNRGIFFTDDPSAQKDHRLGMRYDASGFNSGGSLTNGIKAGVQTTACNDGDDCVQVETESDVIKQGQWQHVAMTWQSGGDLRVYVDGTDVTGDGAGDIGQGTGGTLDAINGLRIAQGATGERWQGRIDEFRVYDQALTASEVQGVFLDTHPCPLTADDVQAGRVTLNDTMSDPSFNEVCFDQAFPSKPLVFAFNDEQDPQPAGIRIRNVTASGFEIAQLEPPGEDGPSGATTVDFVAIVPGDYSLDSGTRLTVDSISTIRYQSGGAAGSTGWATPSFASPFPAAPAVLGQVQTMNNESGSPAPPEGPSEPWLKTAIRDVQTDRFDIALERAEVTSGTVNQAEQIGYLAIEAGRSGTLTNTIDFEAIRTGQSIQGHDDGCFGVGFANSYGSDPLVVASQNTRDGPNGGWLRRCSLDGSGVGLVVDEDLANDGERNHTTERAGILVLSGSFGTHQCADPVDHYAVLDPGQGVTCEALPVTVEARDASDNPVQPASGTTVDVSATEPGTSNPAPDSSWASSGTDQTSHTFGGGSASVTLDLRRTSEGQVNVDVDDGTATESVSADPDIAFVESGFLFYADGTAGAIGGQIAAKPSNVAPGAQSLELRAVEDPNGPTPGAACEARLNDDQTIGMAFECRDPNTCSGTRDVAIDGTAIAANDAGSVNSYANVTLDFGSDGRAPFALRYPDAGQIRLHAREDLPASGDQPAITLTGESNAFVVRPFGLHLEAVGNPGATTPGGGVLGEAGAAFSVEATAVGWSSGDDGDSDGVPDGYGNDDPTDNATLDPTGDNVALPNFGPEADDETVALQAGLWQPDPGSDPGLAGATTIGEAAFEDTGDVGAGGGSTSVNYPEVGIIGLRAQLGDGNYQGGANVVGRSGPVGRFTPADFDVAVRDPGLYAATCNATFSYVGEAFGYDTRPRLDITARSAGGTTTGNYRGNFIKLGGGDVDVTPPASDASASGSEGDPVAVTAALNTGALADDGDGDAPGNGVLVYTFDSGDRYTYDKVENARIDAFNADLPITVDDVTDDDGVTDGDLPSPTPFTPAGVEIRYGRLSLNNTFGPETLDLTVPMRAQFWDGGRFTLNTDESCWVYDTDNDVTLDQSGLSGGSTSVVSVTDSLVAGEPMDGSELVLTSPGEDKTGDVGVTFVVPKWLQDDFDGDGALENPTATATFGVFRGHDRIIYWREVKD